MPDYRRMMDPGPNDPVTLELLKQWNPGGPPRGMELDPAYSSQYLSDEGGQNTLGNLIQSLQGASNRTENIDAGLGRLQGLQEEQKGNLQPLWDQNQESSSPGFFDQLSNGLGSVGGAFSSGLDAMTPSQGTVDNLAMRLQNAHAIGTGHAPLWMQQQDQMMQMGQQHELMQMRRAQLVQQMEQINEQKRAHHMGMVEKLLSTGNVEALEAYGKEFPPAAMLAKASKEADLAEIPLYIKKGWITPAELDEFSKNKWTPNFTKAKLGQLRKRSELVTKHEIEKGDLKNALNKDPKDLDPYEADLVKQHQSDIAINEAKLKETNAQIEERTAHAEKLRKEAETGGPDKLLGVDREAITQELYGPKTRYSTLDQKRMKQVNDRLLNFQGLQQLNKSMAVQQAQLQVPDKPSQTDREKTTEDLSVFDAIDNLNSLYSSDFVGPARGRAGAVMETLGGITTDEAKFRASNAALKNHIIKMITGAQMSEPEAQRIREQIPEPHNPPEVWEARLQQTRKNAKFLADRRREVLKGSGIDVSGLPEIGKKKQQSPQVDKQKFDKVQSVLDEVLGK